MELNLYTNCFIYCVFYTLLATSLYHAGMLCSMSVFFSYVIGLLVIYTIFVY